MINLKYWSGQVPGLHSSVPDWFTEWAKLCLLFQLIAEISDMEGKQDTDCISPEKLLGPLRVVSDEAGIQSTSRATTR